MPILIGQQSANSAINKRATSDNKDEYSLYKQSIFPTTHTFFWRGPQSFKKAESLSLNNVTQQIAREDI